MYYNCGASVAANIGHSYLLLRDKDNAPLVGGLAIASVWPVLVIIAVEIIARVIFPSGWPWWLSKYVGLVAVAVVAAVTSFTHMSGLMLMYGEERFVAYSGPIAIDGLMVLSSVALLAIGENTRRAAEAQRDESGELNTESYNGSKAVRRRGNAAQLQQEAQEAYLKSLEDGKPLTGAEIGELAGRSDRWGRAVKAAVEAPESS